MQRLGDDVRAQERRRRSPVLTAMWMAGALMLGLLLRPVAPWTLQRMALALLLGLGMLWMAGYNVRYLGTGRGTTEEYWRHPSLLDRFYYPMRYRAIRTGPRRLRWRLAPSQENITRRISYVGLVAGGGISLAAVIALMGRTLRAIVT